MNIEIIELMENAGNSNSKVNFLDKDGKQHIGVADMFIQPADEEDGISAIAFRGDNGEHLWVKEYDIKTIEIIG